MPRRAHGLVRHFPPQRPALTCHCRGTGFAGRCIMAIIAKRSDLFTLINVFTVRPEDQDRLIGLLVEATEKTMKHLPGFISASIHKSHDRTRVVNYAQWNSKEDFEAMRSSPEAAVHMKAAAELAQFDPIACEVTESIEA
jgi:heme-degrading monooxygenase HmoA